MRRIPWLIALLLTLTVIITACGDKQKLVLRLEPSDVQSYRVTIDQIYSLRRQASFQQEFESHQIFDLEQEILPTESAEQTRIRVVFRRIRLHAEARRNDPIQFDTSADPQGLRPSERAIYALLDRAIVLTFDTSGELTKIEGLEAVFQAARRELAGAQVGREALATLRQHYGRSFFLNLYGAIFTVFPEKPQTNPPQWQRKRTIYKAMLGTLTFKQTCREVESEGNTTIAFEGLIRPELQPAGAQGELPSGGTVLALKQGTVQGEVTFDLKKGRLEKLEQEMLFLLGFAGEDNRHPNQKTTIKTYMERL